MTGLLPVPPFVHPITKELLENGSRSFASTNNLLLLEHVYTTTVNTFSQLAYPTEYRLSKTEPLGMRGIFPIIDEINFAGLRFEVWQSLGGHLAGQLFFYEPEAGLLFTSDAILNFATLTPWRLTYGSIPDYLITSVNINREVGRYERAELMKLAVELDAELREKKGSVSDYAAVMGPYRSLMRKAVSPLSIRWSITPRENTLRDSITS